MPKDKQPKPSLLKPGAEVIGATFRLGRKLEKEVIHLPNGHREVIIKCTLVSLGTQMPVAEAFGSCSTMESKYRFRTENTGKAPPEEWWQDRSNKDLIGGDRYSVEKKYNPLTTKTDWVICEKVEVDSPADVWNTVLKMSEKRAYVGAILAATACSDMFSQEEDPDMHDESDPGTLPTEAEASQAPTEPRQVKPAPAKQTQSQPTGGAWEDVEIHWTKRKGQKLGELENDSLAWYAGKGDTAWKLSARSTQQDKDLQAAAQVGLKARLQGVVGGMKPKEQPDAPQGKPGAEDTVPF